MRRPAVERKRARLTGSPLMTAPHVLLSTGEAFRGRSILPPDLQARCRQRTATPSVDLAPPIARLHAKQEDDGGPQGEGRWELFQRK